MIGDTGDIWSTADGMYLAYQPLSGDGSIVARLTGVENQNAWSRGGVMIRESLAAGSTNAYLFLSAGKTLAFQRRLTANGSTFATLGATNIATPRWLRLDRVGNTFTGYQSADGVSWTWVGSDTIPMAASVLVGIGGSSLNATHTSTSTYSNVTVTPGTPTAPAAAAGAERAAVGMVASGCRRGRLHRRRVLRQRRRRPSASRARAPTSGAPPTASTSSRGR